MTEHQSSNRGANDCEIVEELLSGFYDEELNETADAFVRHHLDACEQCAAKLDELKATVVAINELPREATPERDLWSGILERSAQSSPIPLRSRRKRRWSFSTPTLLAATLAALMLPAGILGVGIMLFNAREAERAPVLAQAAPPAPDERSPGVFADTALVFVRPAPVRADPQPRLTPEQARAVQAVERQLVAMIQALDDEDAEIRKTAASALGEFQDERALAALVRALSDRDAEVRRWAAWALGEIGRPHPDAVRGLVGVLERDAVAEVRRWGAWALGEIDDPMPASALARALLNDNSAEVRRWAAWALSEIDVPTVAPELVQALQTDASSEVRREAARALGEIDFPGAVPGLANALESDADFEVRRWSAWALGEIQSPSATDGLVAALRRDESAEVRRWTAWALGEIGDPRAIEVLTEATRDENAEVRMAAIRALGEIRN